MNNKAPTVANTLKTRAEPKRFKWYYILMNLCTGFALVLLSDLIHLAIKGYSYLPDSENSLFIFVAVSSLVFGFLVPLFLVFARFMRDDYAEMLWRRSVASLAYVCAALPILLFCYVWGLSFLADDEMYRVWGAFYFNQFAFDDVMFAAWAGYMLLFVVIFQFLRWKDSR